MIYPDYAVHVEIIARLPAHWLARCMFTECVDVLRKSDTQFYV